MAKSARVCHNRFAMRSSRIFHVDAFAQAPFSGNPAAVCLLEEAADPVWMQNVAREMNLSETAFVIREGAQFRLRWFTPKVEVPLCGHATLASAHVLWEAGLLAEVAKARFLTMSGELIASRRGEWIELDFPAKPVHEAVPRPGLLEALGVSAQFVGSDGTNDLVLVASEEEVKEALPNFRALKEASPFGAILTGPSSLASFDFVSRYFAPSLGVNEDPVTGSSHCALGPFWQGRLQRSSFAARQISERGGVLRVDVVGGRVLLGGKAVTVLKGELTC